MKMFLAAAALTVSTTPVFAADYVTAKCMSGRYHEPLCERVVLHRGRTVIIVEREPDAIISARAPYVIVNMPRR